MKYDILTDTAFFKAVQNGNLDEATACYGGFIERVVDVCSCTDGKPMAFATLSYTEVELNAVSGENPKTSIMIEKVLSFIHNMQKMVEDMPSSELKTAKMSGPSLKWTGGVANLVNWSMDWWRWECVNDGDVTIGNLGNQVFGLFGLDPIPYSRTYTNIKSRSVQNGGRAYFLTEMRQMLNERIDQDARIMRGR
jgi:RteC protein.